MNTKLTIQEKLKDLRVERHLTLEQLAEETGISKSALGKYESDDFKDISPFSIVTPDRRNVSNRHRSFLRASLGSGYLRLRINCTNQLVIAWEIKPTTN